MLSTIIPTTSPNTPSSTPFTSKRTPARLILELKLYRSFTQTPTDPLNPFTSAMQTFQTFTRTVLRALQANEPATTSFAVSGTLQELYAGFPNFSNYTSFTTWVQDGTLKHPFRRTAKQHQFLEIVALQQQATPVLSVKQIVTLAIAALQDWKKRAYAPEHLPHDPETLFFFTHNSGLSDIDATASAEEIGQDCIVCTNAFKYAWHAPRRAPCGHVFCRACFTKWLEQSGTGVYTCPLCRACVVCGRNRCAYHVLEVESVPPVQLAEILRQMVPGKEGEALHGLVPERYWVLREETREDRGSISRIEKVLGRRGVQRLDPVSVRLRADYAEIMGRIRRAVIKAVGGTFYVGPCGTKKDEFPENGL